MNGSRGVCAVEALAEKGRSYADVKPIQSNETACSASTIFL